MSIRLRRPGARFMHAYDCKRCGAPLFKIRHVNGKLAGRAFHINGCHTKRKDTP